MGTSTSTGNALTREAPRWVKFLMLGLVLGLVLAVFVARQANANYCQAYAEGWSQYHPYASPSDVEATREMC